MPNGRNNNNNNNNEVQRNQQTPYFTDSQVTTGNVFTGEQRQVRRSTQWDHVPSAQELGAEWREMRNQANQLSNHGLLEQRNYEAGNSSALTYSNSQQNVGFSNIPPIQTPMYDNQGRQIVGRENIRREVKRRETEWAATHGGRPSLSDIEFAPTIGPIQTSMYDESGRLITDQRQIEAEISRREAEWRQWEREGRIQSGEQRTIRTTNDGTFTVNTRGFQPSGRESENLYSRFEEIAENSSSSQISSNREQETERYRVESRSKAQQEDKSYPQFRRK